jgi:hypothetical protein
MSFTFFNIFYLLLGLCGILFNKIIVHWSVAYQYGITGKLYKELIFRICFYVGGTVFMIFGILGIFNIMKN